jgi:hypothetical protein
VFPPTRPLRRPSHGTRRGRARLAVEQLEPRHLPSAGPLTPISEAEPNDVLSQANPVAVQWVQQGSQPATAQAALTGAIGSGQALSADVDWCTFSLDRPAQVSLTSTSANGTVLGLYNTDGSADPYDPLGHRLLAQAQPTGAGDTSLSRALGPGTYYVAVSGAGNTYFNPFLADSGYAGAGGSYQLTFNATDLGTGSALPSVLNADVSPNPAAPGPLTQSPFVIYLDLSGPLGGAVAGVLDVQLHAAGSASPNLLAGYTYSPSANDLELQLAAPLAPGSYVVSVSALAAGGQQALAQGFSNTFQVAGTGAGDTPATAQPLNLSAGFTQVAGAVGDNPADGSFNANGVSAYQFQITQPGTYALTAEAFAGRIGSPLDPVLSLYQVVGGQLQLVAWNDNTFNQALASPESPVATPLANDPVLYAGLGPGDYYLIVLASGNQPDPFGGPVAFNPTASLGASFLQGGWTTGEYVLNVGLQLDETPPQVVSVTQQDAGAPGGPPESFVITFSEPVNLQQMVYQQGTGQLGAVYITGPGGQQYQPELESYNPATNQATFVMLDCLAPGAYTLHLAGSGAGGITDLAGNPLVGNNPGGDYAVPFAVTGPGPGSNYVEGPNSAAQPQDLGTLAPYYLQGDVVVAGAFAPAEQADYYQFQVLQARDYVLTLGTADGSALPPGTWLTITDVTTGTPVAVLLEGQLTSAGSQVNSDGFVRLQVSLTPGDTYVVTVTGWGAAAYTLHFSNANNQEAPTPLTVGPAPAINQRLLGPVVLSADEPPGPPPATPGASAGTPPVSAATGPGPSAGRTGMPASGSSQDGPFLLVSFKPDGAGPAEAGRGGVVLLAGVPEGLLLNLSVGPVDGTGPGGVVRPGPDVFEQVFSQAPAPGTQTSLGPDLTAQAPDGGEDVSWLWLPGPAGRAVTAPSGTAGDPWEWLSGPLRMLLPPLGPAPREGRSDGSATPADVPAERDSRPVGGQVLAPAAPDRDVEGEAAGALLALAGGVAAGGTRRRAQRPRHERP